MGKKTFWTGIITGAVIGGLVTLFDKDARIYVKKTCSQTKATTQYYFNHPSETVRKVRSGVQTLQTNLVKGAETAMNTLDKLEQSLDKKDHQPQDTHRIE